MRLFNYQPAKNVADKRMRSFIQEYFAYSFFKQSLWAVQLNVAGRSFLYYSKLITSVLYDRL